MTNLTCKMWFTRYELQITIFSLIELQRYCSELLQRNMFKLWNAMLCKKPSLPSPLNVRRNNGKAHLITVMLSWIESTVNWLKTRNLLRNADPTIPYKIGYKPEIYRTAPQYPHVLNSGYFHIEEFPLYFVRSLSCVLRQKFSRL